MPRRSKQEIRALNAALLRLCADFNPLTIRSLFYQAVSIGAIEKTERAYKTVCRLTRNMRRERTLPYQWLVDAGRFARCASTWNGPADILAAARDSYRRDKWQDQPVHVEVWTEKDAVVGVVEQVTDRWQVPLYSCKGYASLSMIYQAVQAWPDKPIAIKYFGDRDPSGADIPRYLREAIYEIYGDLVDLDVCAVTPPQIAQYDLQTRPTKRTDSRAAGFQGESVELDALPPDVLRGLVEDAITSEIDRPLWDKATTQEHADDLALKDAVDAMLESEELD